jgi:hypothetical protein
MPGAGYIPLLCVYFVFIEQLFTKAVVLQTTGDRWLANSELNETLDKNKVKRVTL